MLELLSFGVAVFVIDPALIALSIYLFLAGRKLRIDANTIISTEHVVAGKYIFSAPKYQHIIQRSVTFGYYTKFWSYIWQIWSLFLLIGAIILPIQAFTGRVNLFIYTPLFFVFSVVAFAMRRRFKTTAKFIIETGILPAGGIFGGAPETDISVQKWQGIVMRFISYLWMFGTWFSLFGGLLWLLKWATNLFGK
jgi:hypothetical protein